MYTTHLILLIWHTRLKTGQKFKKFLLKKILNILHKMQEKNSMQFLHCVAKNSNLRKIALPPNARERNVSELLFQAALENEGWFILLTKCKYDKDESPALFWLKFMRDGKNNTFVKKIILKYLIWNTNPDANEDYLARAMKPMEEYWKAEKRLEKIFKTL